MAYWHTLHTIKFTDFLLLRGWQDPATLSPQECGLYHDHSRKPWGSFKQGRTEGWESCQGAIFREDCWRSETEDVKSISRLIAMKQWEVARWRMYLGDRLSSTHWWIGCGRCGENKRGIEDEPPVYLASASQWAEVPFTEIWKSRERTRWI